MPSPWQLQFKDLKSRMKHIFDTKSQCDCTFLVGAAKQNFEGHKLILSTASPVLEEKLKATTENHPKITITDVEPQIFQLMLQYIYTDALDVDSNSLFDLAEAARTYQLPGLFKACLDKSSALLNKSTVLKIYGLALHSTEIELKTNCEEFIQKNTKVVLADSSFEEACPDVLEAVFALEDLDIESEVELLNAVDRYAKKLSQSERTEASVRNMLAKIRFLSLTSEEFAKAESTTSVLSADDGCAILAHIAYDGAKKPMPHGFSSRRDARKKDKKIFKPSIEASFEFTAPDIKNISADINSRNYLIWNIKWMAFMRKQKVDSIDYLGVYVKVLEIVGSCDADLRFILRAENGKEKELVTTHKFTKESPDYGFHFIRISDLLNPINGYVKDGGITFEIHIKIYEPEKI